MRTETSLRRGKYLLAYLLTYSQREEEREDLLLLFFFFLTRGQASPVLTPIWPSLFLFWHLKNYSQRTQQRERQAHMRAALRLLAAALPFARASQGHSAYHAVQPNLTPEARAVRNRVYAQNVTVRVEEAQRARALGRLRSSKNVLNLASADEPSPQSAAPEPQNEPVPQPAGPEDLRHDLPVPIVFAVVTGKEHHNNRAAAAKQTWCASINACIFFSDAPSATLPTISITFDGLPILTEYERAQLRYLPVLDYMRELMTSGRDMKFGKTKWSLPTRATGLLARILPPALCSHGVP